MDQNQTVDNDLQRAIDNITNTTNVDPVFSDPVAAPSSVPEGDTGELGDPVGPFPEPKVEMVAPAPEPIAPLEAMDIPQLNNLPPAPQDTLPVSPEPAEVATSTVEPELPASTGETSAPDYGETNSGTLSVKQIKEAALRDLAPILGNLDLDPTQKFNIYKNIFEELRDYSVLESAYRAAKDMTDGGERAKALLYVVEAIDKM